MRSRRRIKLFDRLRYVFDNSMSAGTIALIGWLGLLAFVIILIAAAILTITGIGPNNGDPVSFGEAAWLSLVRTLDAGTFGADTGWRYRMVMLFVTMSGVFVVSALIGVLSTGLQSRINELRKGRSIVLEKNHTLILGWSPKIFTIISELVTANESERKPRIVILADKDKVEMEDEIRMRVKHLRNTRVICRTGSPTDLNDLDIANAQMTKSIIILSPQDDDADTLVIKTILALVNHPQRRAMPYHIVAELRDPKHLEVAQMVGGAEAKIVLASDLISRITVQTCRQSGLSVIYTELLNFSGDEIYFARVPALEGKTFGEALLAYEDSAVMGVQFASGQVKLNPPMATRINPGDQVIAVSEDDSTFIYRPASVTIDEAALRSAQSAALHPERTLILGWNQRACQIITELNNYVPPNSEVLVVADLAEAETQTDCLRRAMANVRISFQIGDTTDRALLESLNVPSYQHVIILCYSDHHDTNRADAITLVTLLHLRNISEGCNHSFGIVSEMLDVRNRELAEVTHADDFIVSDMLTSLMLAQVSENKYLSEVFADLFDADGSEIYLKPIADYVVTGQPMNFYTVAESARRRSEVALGYRQVAYANDATRSYGVVVNPTKSALVTFTAQDRIIVLAES